MITAPAPLPAGEPSAPLAYAGHGAPASGSHVWTPAPATELAGRERELAQLCTWLDAGPGPRGLVLEGARGSGRTSLWRAGIAAAHARGFHVLAARARPQDAGVALAGLADLLPGVQATGVGPAAARLRDAIGVLVADGPVLLAVDDVSLLDGPSADVVALAVTELADAPVAVLVTDLTGGPAELADALPWTRCAVGALDPGAVAAIIDAHAPALPALVHKRIAAWAQGNPLAAVELARCHSAADVAWTFLPTPPPVLGARLELTLGELTAGELATLQALAVSGRLADARVETPALLVEREDGIVFADPLTRAAVYWATPPGRRRELHARAAGGAEDGIERLVHAALGLDGPDPELAADLERAAGDAPIAQAVALRTLALDVTPPQAGAAAGRRRLALACTWAEAGCVAAAAPALDALADEPIALVWRARLGDLPRAEAGRLLERVLSAGGDASVRVQALAWLGWEAGPAGGDLASAAGLLEAAGALARSQTAAAAAPGQPSLADAAACARAASAVVDALRGRPRPPEPEPEPAATPSLVTLDPRCADALLSLWRGDAKPAARALRLVAQDARDAGHSLVHARTLGALAEAQLRAGAWQDAQRTAARAASLARGNGDRRTARALAALDALMAAHRGEDPGLAPEPEGGLDFDALVREHWAAGLFALAQGRPAAAAAPLERAAELLERAGLGHPGVFPLLPDAIEALAAAGMTEPAAQLAQRLDRQAQARPHPAGAAAAARAQALIALAGNDVARAAELLESAAGAFDDLELPYEAARTRLLLGRARRRAGHRRLAVEALEAAAAAFAALGAQPWVDRCAEEQACTGRRRAAGGEDGLTFAEGRVAALVAAGRSNREVAAELSISVATVESHLCRVYRKLDVRSRTQLARRAVEGGLAA